MTETAPASFSCSDEALTEQWRASRLNNAPETEEEPGRLGDAIAAILGVSAEEPLFACVRVAPQLGGLTWAKGSVPIPDGLVTVAWERDAQRFTLDVSIPVGIHLKPILPARLTDALFVNDEPVHADSQTIRTEECVELAVLPGSDYRFEVVGESPNS